MEEFKESTILMITHREGALDNFDKILKLENGKLKKKYDNPRLEFKYNEKFS